MSAHCRDCEADLLHCHGTVIRHVLLRDECTEPDCTTPEAAHALRVDCEAIGCRCAEALEPAAPARAG
ncbi:hypothetical protein [uncultured Mycolicibacterium sp.]|uniref:hypothetical protein n=1 Tax=uncultured Mycolicibacterium sp. TaxID=2320817 RepID=UPI00260552F2|nr:hypothetical protein [uncultured Mycolicibacterium sp.]